MTFKHINDNEKLSGIYEVRCIAYLYDGYEHHAWEVSFVNESLQDFINATEIKSLFITGIRRLGDNE